MKACLTILLIYLSLLTAGLGSTIRGWGSIRSGMTAVEVSTVIGAPLLQNNGHGFAVWLYDGKSEVVFYRGVVMAWTAPVELKKPSALNVQR